MFESSSFDFRPSLFQKNAPAMCTDDNAISSFEQYLDHWILALLLEKFLIAFGVKNDDMWLHNSLNSPQKIARKATEKRPSVKSCNTMITERRITQAHSRMLGFTLPRRRGAAFGYETNTCS